MTIQDLIEIGFEKLPQLNIRPGTYTYELGRYRYISIGGVGTPNEMMWIYEINPKNDKEIMEPIVCLHNYDYDGHLTKIKIETLINALIMKAIQ